MSPVARYLLETLATVAAVCALAAVVLWGARRAGVGAPGGALQLLGRLPLDARRSVYLVRVGRRVLVLGAGEGGVTKLGEVEPSELASDAPAPRPSFAALLERGRDRAGPAPGAGPGPSTVAAAAAASGAPEDTAP